MTSDLSWSPGFDVFTNLTKTLLINFIKNPTTKTKQKTMVQSATLVHSRPYICRPSKKASCSSSFHLPECVGDCTPHVSTCWSIYPCVDWRANNSQPRYSTKQQDSQPRYQTNPTTVKDILFYRPGGSEQIQSLLAGGPQRPWSKTRSSLSTC